ncbi:hypothetical protein FPF71_13980 [Algibacter amylolyticus]|uniref:Uncharacterized protein n=1 Tax=Algibacter amylolyticus TaxID=1608400 RepID=A0A5M7B904_9FLAO|nr:hypothetical protein [Algibacter amylolyticus]KAA5823795.1 hypothetical protein F2B50_13980 [Algibacter amylolyticus]MBB5267969.1 hypothetical protein [Algibacter amylolyticus]TSJ74283.1 hypothetical protein FPF71_13980 [Algibacter amylolyticus]
MFTIKLKIKTIVKGLIMLCFVAITQLVSAQQGFNYKAILKDADDNVLSNTYMTVQFSIHQNTASGAVVYQEDHNYTTDANGLVILNIGTDTTPSIGDFSTIEWGKYPHFLQTSITYSGGTINFDATEFMAVPYAKHSQIAERIITLPEPYILGRSSISSNARFQYNGKHGWQAAQKMCEATYPGDPNVRAFTLEQITQAIVLGNYDEANLSSIDQVRFWAITPITYNVNNTYFPSAHENNAQGLNINAGDSGRGTIGEIRIEDSTFIENGSNPFKTYLKVFNGIGPNFNYPCMCGTYK